MDFRSQVNGSGFEDTRMADSDGLDLQQTNTEGSLTPRASRDGGRVLQNDFDGEKHQTLITEGRRHTVAGNSGATLMPDETVRRSSIAPSISSTVERGYASSIATEATETPLMHRESDSATAYDQYSAIRRMYGPPPRVNRTTGRKVYVAACNVVDVMVPLDMNHEAESMRDSSIYKMGQAVRGRIAKKA